MLCGTPKSDIASWRDKRIFVLGDVMLDRFVSGRVERLSPEAPIPILHFQSEKFMVGGAANVARNIAALAGKAVLVGVLGEDEHGDLIARSVAELEHVEGSFVRVGRHPTTVKLALCRKDNRSCVSTSSAGSISTKPSRRNLRSV